MSKVYSDNNFEFFISNKLIPQDFSYPSSYLDFVKESLPNLEPWDYFFDKEEIDFFFRGLQERYPKRILVPFARRVDNDDVACFDGADTSGDSRVMIIHDRASPGWENHGEFENFLEWLDFAKEQAKEWKMLGGT